MALMYQGRARLKRGVENGAAAFRMDCVRGAVGEAQRDLVRLIVHEAGFHGLHSHSLSARRTAHGMHPKNRPRLRRSKSGKALSLQCSFQVEGRYRPILSESITPIALTNKGYSNSIPNRKRPGSAIQKVHPLSQKCTYIFPFLLPEHEFWARCLPDKITNKNTEP